MSETAQGQKSARSSTASPSANPADPPLGNCSSARDRGRDAGIRLHDRRHRAICIVPKMLDRDSAAADRAVQITDRKCGVMQEEIPVSLELHDRRMDGEAVLARSRQLTAIGPRTTYRGSG